MLNPRLETFYKTIVCEESIMLYNFTNIDQIPKIERIILSSTSKTFCASKLSAIESFSAWHIGTGQKSLPTRARKSIALFNIREEMLLGLKVTLRKKSLFSFLDKILTFALPKIVSSLSNIASNNNIKSDRFEKNLAYSKVPDLEKKQRQDSQKNAVLTKEKKALSLQMTRYLDYFTISNDSALFFPEISFLPSFFTNVSGFSLSFLLTGVEPILIKETGNLTISSTPVNRKKDKKEKEHENIFYRKVRDFGSSGISQLNKKNQIKKTFLSCLALPEKF